ncbi:beta-glucosidase-like protein 2 [Artemisia annua]|uniref:Beta-glucosidase-like protein 2 n=1 Tax=Artemisia annua TaxID=35608 RepID=A0A2U1P4L7_ARTAN|nr:beta-glucosidase-like protein 2 [Artemisia annua]
MDVFGRNFIVHNSFLVDSNKGKVKEKKLADAHVLRLLHNKHLQWRFSNARVDNTMKVQRSTAQSYGEAHEYVERAMKCLPTELAALDLDALLDWVCLQLPHEVGKEEMNCLEINKDVPLSHCLRLRLIVFSNDHDIPMNGMVSDYKNGLLVTCLGIPMIYEIDISHVHNNVYKSISFRHNIGLRVTRDPLLIKKIGSATALKVRATRIRLLLYCTHQDISPEYAITVLGITNTVGGGSWNFRCSSLRISSGFNSFMVQSYFRAAIVIGAKQQRVTVRAWPLYTSNMWCVRPTNLLMYLVERKTKKEGYKSTIRHAAAHEVDHAKMAPELTFELIEYINVIFFTYETKTTSLFGESVTAQQAIIVHGYEATGSVDTQTDAVIQKIKREDFSWLYYS